MSEWTGWTMSRQETKAWLDDAHRRRLNAGRKLNAALGKCIDAAREAGREWHAEMLSRQLHRKSISFARVQRQREEAERERDRRRVGAAVRRAQREIDRVKTTGHTRLFEFEPSRSGPRLRAGRDLYWEWISRGFQAGRKRAYKKSTGPRIRAREAKWADGEFEDKIVYIEREDALEDVPGNIVSNMGADQGERLGCAGRIEEIERLSRKDAGVYVHSILALPADLTPEGRAGLLKDLCRNYERLGLPHTAALHKPDTANSQKNFHAHILVNLRPMKRVADRWEFAATKLTWLGTPAGLKLQRRLIARAFNKALAAEKVQTRWTHRSRAADGLAPRGFTKRGGVRQSRATDEDVRNVLAAQMTLEETEALDQALGGLGRVAERLEACEAGLQELSEKIRARDVTVSDPAERSQPAATEESIGNVAAVSTTPSVAKSQREGQPRSDGMERSPLAVQEDAKDQDKTGLEAVENPPTEVGVAITPVQPPVLTDLEEHRRRRLARARRRVIQQAYYAALNDEERGRLNSSLDAVMHYLSNGSVVVTTDNGVLRMSASGETLDQIVGDVANSQPGWLAIQALADAIGDIAPPHHYPPRVLEDPADDWLFRLALHQRGGMVER